MAAVQQALEDFRLLVLNRANLLCNVTLPENDMKHALAVIKGISGALPHDTPQAPPPAALETLLGSDYADLRSRAYALDALMEGLHITSQVNYVAKAANLYDYGYQFNGAALVGMRLAFHRMALGQGPGARRRLRRVLPVRPLHRHAGHGLLPRSESGSHARGL